MNRTSFVLKGDLCHSQNQSTLDTLHDGYLVCINGQSAGMYAMLPERYASLPQKDFTGHLILPGLTDLHVHAPQYAFRGLGMDLELLDWLNQRTFPEEAKYKDLDYARHAYTLFSSNLARSATTRACIFATAHTEATLLLMDLLEESGLETMVGRVNMDRNCPDDLREPSSHHSIQETAEWLARAAGRYQHVQPILTPRFIPTCSDELMERLADLQRTHRLPVQSHLSENAGEAMWVQELCPNSRFYGDAYDTFGLFGGAVPTIMAHCVLSGEDEIALMRERGVYVAHCPQSNTNLSSGIAPIRRYLNEGLQMGLGSDVAGGFSLSIFRAMSDAIQVSKLRWRLLDQSLSPLTVPEAFWLGTVGGGSFFGNVGSFASGYELDAVILNDSRTASPIKLSIEERLARVIYLSEDQDMIAKFVKGKELFTQ